MTQLVPPPPIATGAPVIIASAASMAGKLINLVRAGILGALWVFELPDRYFREVMLHLTVNGLETGHAILTEDLPPEIAARMKAHAKVLSLLIGQWDVSAILGDAAGVGIPYLDQHVIFVPGINMTGSFGSAGAVPDPQEWVAQHHRIQFEREDIIIGNTIRHGWRIGVRVGRVAIESINGDETVVDTPWDRGNWWINFHIIPTRAIGAKAQGPTGAFGATTALLAADPLLATWATAVLETVDDVGEAHAIIGIGGL